MGPGKQRARSRGLFDCEQCVAIVDVACRFLLLRVALTRMKSLISPVSIWLKECNLADAFLTHSRIAFGGTDANHAP
jgi:hypothetical protein